MSPLVSIVLPTYNGAKYIERSVNSCLDQTYKNIELIIVNDCSTDNTLEIIERLASQDSRIRIISNPINKKLPGSLNHGFDHAAGKYFTWTSDDNYYAKTAIETMAYRLEEASEEQLVYCDYTIIDENDKVTGRREFGDINSGLSNWLGCGACFLYQRDIHEKLKGYDPAAFLIEDYDFFVRALTLTRFIYIHESDLYFYREHSASLTSLYGHYNFHLQKIVIERQLTSLLRICSDKEKAKLLRKFAVYYSTGNPNSEKAIRFFKELKKQSSREWLLTIIYIPVLQLQRLFKTIGISLRALISGSNSK